MLPQSAVAAPVPCTHARLCEARVPSVLLGRLEPSKPGPSGCSLASSMVFLPVSTSWLIQMCFWVAPDPCAATGAAGLLAKDALGTGGGAAPLPLLGGLMTAGLIWPNSAWLNGRIDAMVAAPVLGCQRPRSRGGASPRLVEAPLSPAQPSSSLRMHDEIAAQNLDDGVSGIEACRWCCPSLSSDLMLQPSGSEGDY